MTLDAVPIGRTCYIDALHSSGLTRRRLLGLGFIPGTPVTALRRSPLSDPTAYLIRSTVIALRCEDAAAIAVVL